MLLFVISGCASASSELITTETTFQEIKEEGVFAAIFTWPFAQAINFLAPKISVAGAITVVTVVLNAIILAFTYKSSVSMQRMQTIQPELEKIQKKYEGKTDNTSQQRMAMEMQNLYQKYDIHPFGALAVTFIQLPVLISMYTAVRRSEAVVNGSFFGYTLSTTPMDAFKQGAFILVAVYVLMIVTQFLSIKLPQILANQKAKAEAEAKHKHYEKPQQQNQMMTYSMLLMISFMMLNWPTALSLYYCIYSVINIAKTLVINKLVK